MNSVKSEKVLLIFLLPCQTLGSAVFFTLIIGFLKMGNEIWNHSANLFAKLIKLLVIIISDIVLVLCNLKLCPHFSAGTLGDIEKLNKFGFTASLESFSHVGKKSRWFSQGSFVFSSFLVGEHFKLGKMGPSFGITYFVGKILRPQKSTSDWEIWHWMKIIWERLPPCLDEPSN